MVEADGLLAFVRPELPPPRSGTSGGGVCGCAAAATVPSPLGAGSSRVSSGASPVYSGSPRGVVPPDVLRVAALDVLARGGGASVRRACAYLMSAAENAIGGAPELLLCAAAAGAAPPRAMLLVGAVLPGWLWRRCSIGLPVGPVRGDVKPETALSLWIERSAALMGADCIATATASSTLCCKYVSSAVLGASGRLRATLASCASVA